MILVAWKTSSTVTSKAFATLAYCLFSQSFRWCKTMSSITDPFKRSRGDPSDPTDSRPRMPELQQKAFGKVSCPNPGRIERLNIFEQQIPLPTP